MPYKHNKIFEQIDLLEKNMTDSNSFLFKITEMRSDLIKSLEDLNNTIIRFENINDKTISNNKLFFDEYEKNATLVANSFQDMILKISNFNDNIVKANEVFENKINKTGEEYKEFFDKSLSGSLDNFKEFSNVLSKDIANIIKNHLIEFEKVLKLNKDSLLDEVTSSSERNLKIIKNLNETYNQDMINYERNLSNLYNKILEPSKEINNTFTNLFNEKQSIIKRFQENNNKNFLILFIINLSFFVILLVLIIILLTK